MSEYLISVIFSGEASTNIVKKNPKQIVNRLKIFFIITFLFEFSLKKLMFNLNVFNSAFILEFEKIDRIFNLVIRLLKGYFEFQDYMGYCFCFC